MEDPAPGERTGDTDPDPGTEPDQPAVSTKPPLTSASRVASFFPVTGTPARLEPAPESLVEFRGKLFFATNYEDGHAGLWTSNGTSASTVEVKDLPKKNGSQSHVSQLTPLGTQLFFVANDGTHGSELWVSDGSTAGTRLVKDVTPGVGDSSPSGLAVVGQGLLFFRFVPETTTGPSHTELWRSDGTAAGTVRIKDLGTDAYPSASNLVLDGTLYFGLTDATHGSELWKSDGTAAGTQLVKDITPGTASSFPSDLRAVGHKVFFLVAKGSGSQLWRTDGNAAGTVLVEDLTQNGADPYAELLPPVGSTLYLALSDYTDQLMRLYALSVSSSGGTQRRLVATLPNPYAAQTDAALPIVSNSAVAEGKLFFGLFIGSSGPAPRDVQLWVTDGTQGGTKLVVRPLSLSDEFQSEIYAVDNRVLFAATPQAKGLEPWVSDGTSAGTRQVQDITPGANGSFPRSFLRVGNAVYFVAYDPTHGNSLWMSPPGP